MDYEKKYKEALERMKSWAKGEHPECFSEAQKAAEFVFPELRESEDDRIRKGIIDFLWKEKIFLQEASSHVENNPKYRFVMDAIAWLEKQKDTNVLIQEASEKAYTEGMRVERKHWLEKQGASIDVDSILNKVGINPAYKDGNAWCILYGDNIQDGFCGFGHTKEEALVEFLKDLLERQGEQPADKPKFKVGDWVVWDNKISCHVDNIYQGKESLMYTITDTNNMTRNYSVKGFDNNVHLWTIQDTKDGDVLYSPTHHLVWIYKDDKHYYVCVNLNYTSNNVSVDGSISVPNDVCPATTDERTILFAKMKEAGYEWDTEEKELRKIEQKPAWSKEDECIYQSIIDDTVQENQLDSKQIDWLKSLKDRVQPQPKIEWSEEDEDNLRFSERHFKTLLTNTYYDTFCNWLKSVKERLGGK